MRNIKSLFVAAIALAVFVGYSQAQVETDSALTSSSTTQISVGSSQTVIFAASGNRLGWSFHPISGTSTVGVYFVSQTTTSTVQRLAAFSNAAYWVTSTGTVTPNSANYSCKPNLWKGTVYGITDILNTTNVISATDIKKP